MLPSQFIAVDLLFALERNEEFSYDKRRRRTAATNWLFYKSKDYKETSEGFMCFVELDGKGNVVPHYFHFSLTSNIF